MFTKNKVQISTYMVLLIPFIFLGIFASGLFSFPDLSLVNIGDKVVYLLYHIWEYKRYITLSPIFIRVKSENEKSPDANIPSNTNGISITI